VKAARQDRHADAARDRLILGVFILALALFVAVGMGAFVYFGRFGEQTDWVRHTERVLGALGNGLGELKDAETGQRGYLLTGDEQFLEPYERSVAVVDEHFASLAELTADNPAQQRRLRELRPLITQKLAFTQHTVEVYRAGRHGEAVQLIRSRQGKQMMDEIRRRVAEMEAEERALLASRMDRAQTTAWLTNVLILLGNGFAFALLSSGTFLLGRELNRRRGVQQQGALRRERQDLAVQERAHAERLQTVLDKLPVGVVLIDPERRVIQSNEWAQAFFGRGAVPRFLQADGTPYPPGLSPVERALHAEIVRAEELQVFGTDGTAVPAIASLIPVRGERGDVTYVVAAFDDLTAAKRSEEEQRQARLFRDLFVGALGHDLRNPLSVITAGAASLARRSLPPAQTKIVNHMAWSAERMATMIDQLLDITQVRLGGGLAIEPRIADLGTIARRAAERLEVSHPERTLTVVTEGDLGGEWDERRLAQALGYLLTNALEHGRAGGTVRLSVTGAGEDVIVEVHNEGNPIPPDLLPLIFDPFRRASERRRMRSKGLGLGLYLALQIVKAHGGDLQVESSTEAGTNLRVTIPRHADQHPHR
jgi:signal transduction histidine kinase